jgi:hypothetical protein
MTTNTDRIIQALHQWPGLDDDELERRADVHPRQQVNQICRRLEQQGVLKRIIGTNGKIGNVLLGSQAPTSLASPSGPSTPERFTSFRPSGFVAELDRDNRNAVETAADVSSTFFVIPCSSTKVSSLAARETGPSLLKVLPPALAQRLRHARDAMRVPAHIDETTLLPAWRRYGGTLYQTAARALADAEDRRLNVLIVSGGYGLVLADEPIGYYDALFRLSSWPRGLLEEILTDYAQSRKLSNVRAITSSTGDYRKLLTRVRWAAAGIDDALLLSPRAGPGAMVLSPRAQGEALSALLQGKMDASWSSSDGLRLDVQRLA